MTTAQNTALDLSQRERVDLRLGGFGGQGIILAGVILGRAATVYAGRNAVMSQSFGPESRGGACIAEIIIASGEISYPRVVSPDLSVMMSQEAYKTYASTIPAQSILIIDEDLVKLEGEAENGRRCLKAPATRLAEGLGRRIVANMAMLGFIGGATRLIAVEALREAVASSVPKGTQSLNLQAFDAGYQQADKLFFGNGGAKA